MRKVGVRKEEGCDKVNFAVMISRILIVLCVFFALIPAGTFALAPPPTLGQLVGETLEFRICWGMIPVGKASLEVVNGGGGTLRFRARAQSLPFIDTVYPVQDFIESSVLQPGIRVLRYYKKAKEGWSKPRVDEVLFDHETGTSRLFRNGAPRERLKVPQGIQDPLSCFFAYRTTAVKGDGQVTLDITDGKKLTTAVVSVLGREKVETPAGSFQTVLIEPKIEGIGGIFEKSPGARILIWLTDDNWRMPVKLQSKVIVGHFTAEIVKILR